MTLVGNPRNRRGPARPLVAAARPLEIRPNTGRVEFPAGMDVDDTRLWNYYRNVDVVHFGMGFKRNAALRAKFFPALRGDDPYSDPEAIAGREGERSQEESIAIDVFQRLDGGRGRVAEAVGDLLVHLDVVGMGFPVYQQRKAQDGVTEDRLTVYSTLEIKRQEGGGLVRLNKDGTQLSSSWQIQKGDIGATVWRPSPDRRSTPDSPLRSVADECDLLLAMTAMFTASMMTRMNNGLLGIPDSMRPPKPPRPAPGEEPQPDPFLLDVLAALQAPITNPNHPSRFVPYILSGPDDALGKVQKVDLGRTINAHDLMLLEVIQGRVATGIDLPPEIISGLAKMNHWGAWQVDATTYRQHVDPPLLLGLDGFTRQIYWPMLRLAGIADPTRYVIWRDISALTASANRVQDAVALWDRGIIGSPSVRGVAGYDDTDARTDNPDPAPPGLGGAPEASPSETPPPEGPPDSPSPTGSSNGAASRQAVLAAAPRISGRRLADLDRALSIRLSDAAEAASQRALDRAGARVRSRARADSSLSLVIDGIPNRDAAWRLGAAVLSERLGITAADLVTEEDFSGLERDGRRLLDRAVDAAAEETERLGGFAPERDPDEESRAVDAAVVLLVATTLASTRARLYTPGPEPDPADTGEIPDARALSGRDLIDVTTVAGGGSAGMVPDANGFDVGVGNGPRSVSQLRAAELVTVAYRWIYGDRAARGVNFEPHLVLEGIEFDRWDDPALTNYNLFPRVSRFYPGDHRGCLCSSERILWHL